MIPLTPGALTRDAASTGITNAINRASEALSNGDNTGAVNMEK